MLPSSPPSYFPETSLQSLTSREKQLKEVERMRVIEGESLDVITKASERIQAIVDEAVRSPAYQYSHFVSLPLAIHPELVDKLVRFQCTILGVGDSDPKDVDVAMDDVSSEEDEDNKINQPGKELDVSVKLKVEDDRKHVNVAINVPLVAYARKTTKSPTFSDLGIDKSIFIKPKTFHLTVLMLKLWNKERIHAATEVLQNVSSKVIEVLDNRPLFVRLKGLDCMRGSKAKAHVLYAPVEEIGNEDRLSRACQVITDAYVQAGLVLEKDIGQKLKLHATVMNTTHRKTRNRKGRGRSQPFDARGIFEKFGSEHWGDYHIREAHLSQRFLYGENGYYHCCTSIPFPENASSS